LIQAIQIIGALAILAAFIMAQARILTPSSLPYLILNLAGSAVLAVIAYVERQWGFLLLEGIWALVSAWSLIVVMVRTAPTLQR
jgi:hypothetical protein